MENRFVCSDAPDMASSPVTPELRMWSASGASHGSSKCSSTTSISGHTARSGNHGSAFGSLPVARASALETSVPGNGKSMLAHTPSCAPGVTPELGGEALAQPALDALRRHGDDLGCHRVLERLGDQPGQHRHQGVGAIGSVDVQHPGRVRRRCSRACGSASLQLGGLAYAEVPVFAPPSGKATMVGCPPSSSSRSG